MILSHTIKSKNIVVKQREREKTITTGAEYQAACTKLMPIKKDGSVSVKT